MGHQERLPTPGRRLAVATVAMLLPLQMGGCPDFRNETVTAFETAARGVIDAGPDLLFTQLRPDEFR